MKKYIILLTLAAFAAVTAYAQPTFTWAKHTGGNGNQQCFDVSTDTSGNSVSAGWFNDSTDFDPDAGTYYLYAPTTCAFISKLNTAGGFIWAKSFSGGGSVSYGVAVDDSANVYVTGYFQNTVDFDPGAGVYSLTSVGGRDIFIAKLDVNGNFVWAVSCGGSGNDVAQEIANDEQGNVYVTGYFEDTVDFDPGAGVTNLLSAGSDDCFVLKLSTTGNLTWARRLGGAHSNIAYGIAVDNSGAVYISGHFYGLCDFNPSPVATYNLNSLVVGSDAFICKLNAAGNFVWAFDVGGNNNDYAYSVTTDRDANVYIGGSFGDGFDFDLSAGYNILFPSGPSDGFLWSLDSTGGFRWAIRMGSNGSDACYAVTLDAGSHVYATGVYTNGSNPFCAFILKADALGLEPWETYQVGARSFSGNGVATDADGNVLIGGNFRDTIDFDFGPGTYELYGEDLNQDAFLVKYGCTTAPSAPLTIWGDSVVCAGAPVNFYLYVSYLVNWSYYTWTLPDGSTGNSNASYISFTAGSSGPLSVVAENACGTSAVFAEQVVVNPAPMVTYSQSPDTVCDNSSALVLTAATPAGGNYSGPSVAGNSFDPAAAGVGMHNVVYTYTDANGCTGADTSAIVVEVCTDVETPEVNIPLVYPNPAADVLTIANISSGTVITFSNALGETVHALRANSTVAEISIAHLPAGVYMVSLVSGDSVAVVRVVRK